MEDQFEIKIHNLHWLPDMDESKDPCVHGCIRVRINETNVVSEKDGCEWTLSSTALYLLRSLESDYVPDKYASQLVPCCGFNMIADGDDFVILLGCPNGFDWQIKHEGNNVKHTAKNGESSIIAFNKYKEIVLEFAEEINAFYKKSAPKNPSDEDDILGFKAFWKEWESLLSKWKNTNNP